MHYLLRRFLDALRPLSRKPIEGTQDRWWGSRAAALAEVEQAVVVRNVGEVERAMARQRERLGREAGDGC